VGVLGSAWTAAVNSSGQVAPAGEGWTLDWWIGAEDRWHRPSEERAVRQTLVDGSPVVQTSVRIPGGDAVQRVWAVAGPGGPTVVAEVENASAVPVAVALVLAAPGARRVQVDGAVISVDGRPAVALASGPHRVAGSVAGVDEVFATVAAGSAGEPPLPEVVVGPAGEATVALVYPLPHTARIRALLPLGSAAVPDRAIADAEAVARGWAAQADHGARVELPSPRLAESLVAVRRSLLLRAQASGDLSTAGAQEVAGALARWGMGEEALAVLSEVARRPWSRKQWHRRSPHFGGWVDAASATWDAVGSDRFEEVLGGVPAFDDLRRDDPPQEAALDVALAWLPAASPTWQWQPSDQGGVPAATWLGVVRRSLVRDTKEGLALLPSVPPAWLGQGVEAHGLPTRWGHLSFAVRWHGARPALLWEVAPSPPARVQGPPVISSPGLDPGWSTHEPSGEALLAEPAEHEEDA